MLHALGVVLLVFGVSFLLLGAVALALLITSGEDDDSGDLF